MRLILLWPALFVVLPDGAVFGRDTIVADSVAEYSGVRGGSGWYYGFYPGPSFDPNGFRDLDYLDNPAPQSAATCREEAGDGLWQLPRFGQADGHWTSISRGCMVPNGKGGGVREDIHWVVRRWESDVSGTLEVRGLIRLPTCQPADVHDGVGVHIWRRDPGLPVQKVETILLKNSRPARLDIPSGAVVTRSFTLDLPNVQVGTEIDFAVSPGLTMNDDLVQFSVVILKPDASDRVLVADSVSDFSGQQGRDGWQYGYYEEPALDPCNFRAMSFDPAAQRWAVNFQNNTNDGSWCLLTPALAAPNGDVATCSVLRSQIEQWAVRRWTSDSAGEIVIEGRLALEQCKSKNDRDAACVDGTVARFFVDDTEVFTPFNRGPKALPNFRNSDDFSWGRAESYRFRTQVEVGTTIDFALAPNLTAGWDLTFFTARITQAVFKRGDCTADGNVDVTDPVANLSFQLLGTFEPPCMDSCDFDDNGDIDITDAIGNLTSQFLGTDPPLPPGKDQCGPDPNPDGLACESFPPCRGR